MDKNWHHRDKWFYIFDRYPWAGATRYALHIDMPIDPYVKVHYFYVAKDDTLWEITKEDLEKYCQKYPLTGKYHIDKCFLKPKEIDEEWRERINSYERKVNA